MKFATDYSILGRIVLAVAALRFLPSVEAQFATCQPGWEWSYNSEGQNPCEIAGSLQAPCLGYSVYQLGPLGPGSNYVTPQATDTAGKKCGCNTVIYTLYTACTLCQQNTTTTPITWAFWAQYCDSVYVAQYPFAIPFNATVPHWAFLDDSASAFNPTLAEAAGRDPESTPTAPPIVSLSSSTSSSHTTSNTNTATHGTGTSPVPSSGGDNNNNSGHSKTNVGAIAGGVVGGVIALAGLVALILFLLRRRGAQQPAPVNNILEPSPLAYHPNMTEAAYEQPKLYDPADPSTFPTPVSGGGSTLSGGYTTNPFQPGRYQGAPEL